MQLMKNPSVESFWTANFIYTDQLGLLLRRTLDYRIVI